ncbi:hypothetical protein Bca4012_026202 [Brassica carinata]|uniref:Uncharacterized protein n=1 Tax=Brassica carinata TaxID=52824 RepID=A0A8X7VID1_BRACI|nr:hypothetical protein Bca52824_023285 [Brassica carinata]
MCQVAGLSVCLTRKGFVGCILIVHQDETPLLYSLVFGEGVVNDVTSVVLFNAVQKFRVESISGLTALQTTLAQRLSLALKLTGIEASEAAHCTDCGVQVSEAALSEAVIPVSDATLAHTCKVAEQETTSDVSFPGRLAATKEQVDLEENAPKKARAE